MSVEGNVWNKRSNAWRELMDSATISFDFTTKNQASASVVAGSVGTTQLTDGGVTYAKIQDVSATARLLGRKTAGAGDVEECTLSEALDFIGSAAQGDILYRDASAWARLGTGTAGQLLQSGGAGGNPSWATASSPGQVLLTSGTVTNAAQLDIVLTGYTAYRGIRFVLSAFVPATDDVELWMRVSTDGGSTYDAASYSRTIVISRDNTGAAFTYNSTSDSEIVVAASPTGGESISNVAAEGGVDCIVDLMDQTNTGRYPRAHIVGAVWFGATVTDTFQARGGGHLEVAQDTDAVRFLFESGNIASGKYAVYGYN